MYKIITAILPALLVFSLAQAQINTPAPSPTCEFKQAVGLTDVTLNYSRPGKKDRTIFAADGLVPYGQVWRTGANAATTIEFSEDVNFGGKDVEKGKYALYTIPNAGSWNVMLYSDLSLGGNTGNYDEEKEVVRVSATPVNMGPVSIESLTMDLGDLRDGSATLGIMWDNIYVPVELKVNTDEQVTAQIDRFAENPLAQVAGNYLNSGWYYYNSGKDKTKALDYMSKGLEHSTSPFKFFWMQRKAQVQADLGDYAGAIMTAQKAHETGKSATGNAQGFYDNTVKAQLDDNIKEWTMKKS